MQTGPTGTEVEPTEATPANALIARCDAASAAAFRLRDYLRATKALREAVAGEARGNEHDDPVLSDAFLLIDFARYVKDAFSDDRKLVAFIRGEDLPYRSGF